MAFPPNVEAEDMPPPAQAEQRTLLKKYDIPITHLDYPYVEQCTDGKELERILHILQSGEEGYYPHLLTTTEERLRQVKPTSRYIRKVTPVVDTSNLDKDTRQELDEEIKNFVEDASRHDATLGRHGKTVGIALPAVRTSTNRPSVDSAATSDKPNRIKATDYASWDKYDPDTELLKMDLATEQLQKQQEQEALQQQAVQARQQQAVELEALHYADAYTETEAGLRAIEERLKGNEHYKASDYAAALACYTTSISLQPSIEGYNNRAQVRIMLKHYQQAMADSRAALHFDPHNIKANMRLAQCLHELNRHQDAIAHLEKVIRLDPNNQRAQNLLNTVRSKLSQTVHKTDKTRLKITEISSSSQTTPDCVYPSSAKRALPPATKPSCHSQRRNRRKNFLKKTPPQPSRSKILVPIPGPSHMQEPYYIVLDNNPETLKRAQYILYNKPQVMYVSQPYESDDDECAPTTATIPYETSNYINTSNVHRSSAPTLTDINRKINSFAKNKAALQKKCEYASGEQQQQREESDIKENDQNENLPHISWESPEEEEDCDTDLGQEKQGVMVESPQDQCTLSARSSYHTPRECSTNADEACDDGNHHQHHYYPHHRLPASSNSSPQYRDLRENSPNGGSGEPHMVLNGSRDDHRLEDFEAPFSFLRAWLAARRDETYIQQAKLLRKLNENRLAEVIGYKLDETMLTDILRTLSIHFTVAHEVERVHAFLVNIAALPRFNIYALFLETPDRIKLRSLCEFLEQHGMPLPDTIRSAYL